MARFRPAFLAVVLIAGQFPLSQVLVTPVAAQQVNRPVFEDTFVNNNAGWPSAAPFYFAADGYHLDAREISTSEAAPQTDERTAPHGNRGGEGVG